MTVIFRQAAEDELINAYDWYEKRRAGLGSKFLHCVETCIVSVQQQPKRYPVAARDIRQGIVKRFPYTIFYRIEGAHIIVIAVFHSSRDPNIWKRRA